MAAIAVAANLALCALVAILLMPARTRVDTPLAVSVTSSPTSTSSLVAPTSPSRPSAVPQGFQEVSGPAGIRTVIPRDWQVQPASGPGAVQATDPARPTRFLRYGGSASPAKSVFDAQRDYERDFARTAADYRLVVLEPLTIRGFDAVVWEFEYQADTGPRHVKSVNWRTQGTDFIVYGSAATPDWPDLEPIFDAVLSSAKP